MSIAQKAPFIRYRYDALDRLTGHCQLNDPERLRFYCENRLATEIEGGEQLSIVQHGDQLLAQQQCQSGIATCTLLATDLPRSTLNAVQASLKQSIAYLPYGYHPFGSGLFSLLGFNGHRPDPLSGCYLLGNGYRAFNPVLMRFNSPDRLSPFGKGGVNAFAYCLGDPINRSDPNGSFSSAITGLFSRVFSRTRSPYSFPWQGKRVKPVKNVTRFSENFITFEDTYKGKPRLTFQGHGTRGQFYLGENEIVSAAEFYSLAKSKGIEFEKFASLRLVACVSADSVDLLGKPIVSSAEALSNVSGIPVKGYLGDVRGTDTSLIMSKLRVGEVGKRSYYFGVLKNDSPARLIETPDYNYRPVTFGLSSS